MIKTTLTIKGMHCGMCETHINDTVRRQFPVKKVKADRKKNSAVILSEAPLDEKALKSAIDQTGYTVEAVHSEEYQKHKFSFFKK